MPKPSPLRPSDAELRRLYLDQRLPSTAIAEQCQVEKITVLRWLRAAGIERRPAGTGLATRGLEPPSADVLHDLVHVQHLSYSEIAARYGVDSTAVPYWLKKHGIPRPKVWDTRRRGRAASEPTEQELRDRVARGDSLAAITRDYDVSSIVIRARCRTYGIEVQRDGWRGGHRFTCLDGHLARSTYEERVDNWLYQHGLAHEVEPQYPFDRRYRADFLVNGTYIEVWGVTNNPAYQQRRRWKVQQCREHGLPLIEIGHWQFAKGRHWWRRLDRLRDDRGERLF